MIWATRLEFRYSKEKILSLYISHAPFGGNVVGLDAAAWRYFGHAAEDLSWAEAAMLAVLPNSPAMIHLSKSRQSLLDKRNRLLTRLHKNGTLSDSDYELALSEPLPQEPKPLPQTAPHLTDYFYRTRNGTYSVSTIDRGIQLQVEELVERWNNEFSRSDIRNMAILVIDIEKNQPIAYCGNLHFNKERSGNQVDIIRAPRSTGSILKPFLYYAMLQEGSILPHTLLPDVPININGFAPQNFSQQFEGAVPASEAIARSLNIPTVSMLQHYGVPKFYNLLKQIGLTTLTRPASHYGLSLILGGAEGTLWDITVAYAEMARCLKGLDKTDCSLLLSDSTRHLPSANSHVSLSPGAVWQTFDAIKEVNRPEEIDWRTIPSMQTIAWKTGTSYGFRDAWAVGVTPRYAVGVWVGNASGEGRPGLTGVGNAAPVLFDLFSLLPGSGWFDMPYDELLPMAICRLSGHKASAICDRVDTLYMPRSADKTEVCPYHRLVHLSADGRFRVNSSCESVGRMIARPWFVLPPSEEYYYRNYHIDYAPLPPVKPGCGEDRGRQIELIYPEHNAILYLPKGFSGKREQFVFKAAHARPDAILYWHLDDTYAGETTDHHQISFSASPGKHRLTLIDDQGNRKTISFEVK